MASSEQAHGSSAMELRDGRQVFRSTTADIPLMPASLMWRVTEYAERRGLVLALPARLGVVMVGDTGLEPVTSCMSSKCSNQLS